MLVHLDFDLGTYSNLGFFTGGLYDNVDDDDDDEANKLFGVGLYTAGGSRI